VSGIEELHLYGIGGERLATYQLTYANPDWTVSLRSRNVYFAGRLVQMREGIYDKVVVTDRLGSVVATGSDASFTRRRYFPYGEEQVTTASDTEKFGTYYRDQRTNLDYADQRYYASQSGRFLTPDPYESSAGLGDPQSWNRYSYVQGDPINFNDPTGQMMASVEGGGGGGGVFIIPGLIFSVWKWIFGGAPKNPVVEAWKSNPGAQVAAWDRKIADAREEGEEQDRRYIAALKVVGDCYTRSPFGGTSIRRFTYQPIDEEGQPFARGEYSVTEQNVVVQGGSLIGQATWGPAQQNANGTFSDYVGRRKRCSRPRPSPSASAKSCASGWRISGS
jgi:RHS repeat-associated protein